jgi:hypothetical protein
MLAAQTAAAPGDTPHLFPWQERCTTRVQNG